MLTFSSSNNFLNCRTQTFTKVYKTWGLMRLRVARRLMTRCYFGSEGGKARNPLSSLSILFF